MHTPNQSGTSGLMVRHSVSYLPLLAGFLVCLGTASAGDVSLADTTPSLAAQISSASVLYQPLLWVGAEPPTEAESAALWEEVAGMKREGVAARLPALEQFVAAYPDSPWTPSLRANLGRYYQEHARFRRALDHWEAAWKATRDMNEGTGKQVADYTFAYYTRTLAGLGALEPLRALIEETRDREFERGRVQEILGETRAEYTGMLTQSDISFACGTYALHHVLQNRKTPGYDGLALLRFRSPVTGFTLTRLAELARLNGADLVPARWGQEKTLIVPSVVHWKAQHYAAILEQKNGSYLVLDSVFGYQPRWLSAADIEDEASGFFLVPQDQLTGDWRRVSASETDEIIGRGLVYSAPDSVDTGAKMGPEIMPKTQEPSAPKDPCKGMAVWEVSEPQINLWLRDEPLGYPAGLGTRVAFRISYKQRESRTILTNFFSLGPKWDCDWISYIKDSSPSNQAVMLLPGGGQRIYTPDNATREYYSRTLLERTVSGTNLTGFIVSYPDGARDYYRYISSNRLDTLPVVFLTAQVDPQGRTNLSFAYEDVLYQATNHITRLTSVTDVDGRTSTLSYTNAANASLITGVQDPFTNQAVLQYNGNHLLTNVIDVIGLASSFQYDTNSWITNLVTPYGTTRFQHTDKGFTDPHYFARGVRVIEGADGAGECATNVYIFRRDSGHVYNPTNGLWDVNYMPWYGSGNYPNAFLPSFVQGRDPTNKIETSNMQYRDSFHWGPRQAAELPDDLTLITLDNFIKSTMRHWLHDPASSLSQILDMEQENASPTVGVGGQVTWYDYDGKTLTSREGTNSLLSLVARVVPDGKTWYTWFNRDTCGRPTNIWETYSTNYGATTLVRSNQFIYATNGVDLIAQIGPLGETVRGYSYDTNHNVLQTTNALQEVATFSYDSFSRLTNITTPAGLNTAISYFSSGPYTNWVQQTIDYEITGGQTLYYRTNTFTYTNNLVYTFTDARGFTVTNTWDALRRLLRVDFADAPISTSITHVYDRLDRVRTINRLGYTNSFGFDNLRRLVAQTNALVRVTHFSYCTCGSLDSIEDAEGNTTSFFYDNLGRQTNAIFADGTSVTHSYDLLGRLTNTVDSFGTSVTNWYNNQSLLTASSNAFGRILRAVYDIKDRATNLVDANGVTVTNTFDLLSRSLTRAYPDGGVERWGYTANVPGVTSYTNQLGTNVVLYAYDALGRKTNEVYPGLMTNRFACAPAGDLLTLTDGKGQETSWGYDVQGRTTSKTNAAGTEVFRYQYDVGSRLTNRWSAAKKEKVSVLTIDS